MDCNGYYTPPDIGAYQWYLANQTSLPPPPCSGDIDTCALTTFRDMAMFTAFMFFAPLVDSTQFDCSASKPPITAPEDGITVSLTSSVWPAGETEFTTRVRIANEVPFYGFCFPLEFSLRDMVADEAFEPDDITTDWIWIYNIAAYADVDVESRKMVHGFITTQLEPGVYDSIYEIVFTSLTPPVHDVAVRTNWTTYPPLEYDPHSGTMKEVNTPMVLLDIVTGEIVRPKILEVGGCGDADSSGEVDIDDVVYLIAYIFSGGSPPYPYESGDADCSGGVDIDDVVYLIAYIFSGGNAPCDTDGDEVPDC